jgi:hypothetical protein
MGPYGQVVKEVKARARDFNFVDFAHQNRISNVDTYNLARSLISFVLGKHIWLLTPLRAFVIRMINTINKECGVSKKNIYIGVDF